MICHKLKKYRFVYDETEIGGKWMAGKNVITCTLSGVASLENQYLNIK